MCPCSVAGVFSVAGEEMISSGALIFTCPHHPNGCSFSRGRRDAFKVQGMDVGDITHVAISHDNSGLTPDWHCQQVGSPEGLLRMVSRAKPGPASTQCLCGPLQVEVLHPVNGQNYVFPCAAWLKKTKADGMGGCRKVWCPAWTPTITEGRVDGGPNPP